MGRTQHRGQGDRRHSRRFRDGLEIGRLAVRRWALPFFDGVTFRTYLLRELMTLRRVADRPDRFERRMAKRKPKNYDRLTKPRKEIKLDMIKRFKKI